MRAPDPPLLEQVLQRRRELQFRLARAQVHDPHAVPVRRRVDSGAERLGERFLGREALGEERRRQPMLAKARELGLAQDASREALAEARQRTLDARDLHQVLADAVDHLRAAFAASTISRFISRTASRMPTKIERLTIEWPMCSSRTPGSRATGSTLK